MYQLKSLWEHSRNLKFNLIVERRSKEQDQSMKKGNKIKFEAPIENPVINPIYKRPWKCASILIVDDQYINRFIIAQYAQKYDIPCDEAEDGEEAVHMVLESNKRQCCPGYHLILMDLNMPVMGGIEATREILKYKKQNMISSFIEIIAVTAFVSEKEKEKCIKVGMNDFIPKPFAISDFVQLVAT